MNRCKQKQNLMDEMRDIICEIESLKPEPEVCNVSCPPLGCPRGPCPGMCCSKGICDPCCVSKMPHHPPPLHPPRCCMPRRLKDYTCNAARMSLCDSPSMDIHQRNPTTRDGGCPNPVPPDQSGLYTRTQQVLCSPPPYNLACQLHRLALLDQ